jgi:hypothetical protein
MSGFLARQNYPIVRLESLKYLDEGDFYQERHGDSTAICLHRVS